MSTGTGVDAEAIAAAAARIGDVARVTPVVPSVTLSDRFGAPVVLKAENLQRVGSFKIRGALNKLAMLGDQLGAGVVCGSAGNHAQAVALAAREHGVSCVVVMPQGAPVAKVEATEALGAEVTLHGETVTEAVALAQEMAAERSLTFVHPFEDRDVICGQGTLGRELLEQIPDLAQVVVPVGGGGLIGGVAVAVKSARPRVRVIGVQVERVASMAASLRDGRPVSVASGRTIADGIAVKAPGTMTLALCEHWVDELITVTEEQVADALVLLMEKAKLVVEGAGAVSVAALLAGAVGVVPGATSCCVLSGGNVDPGLLAELARRGESEAGRRHVFFTRVPDRPGGLAGLLTQIADAGANVVEVTHLREGIGLDVGETGVQVVLETRSREHAAAVVATISAAGYAVLGGLSALRADRTRPDGAPA